MILTKRKVALTAFLSLWLCSCASTEPAVSSTTSKTGNVGMNDISGDLVNVNRVALAKNESFIPPLDDENNRIPEYPEGLLAKNLPPSALCMQIVVSEEGTVTGSSLVEQAPSCPPVTSLDPLMIQSVEQTVSAWRFEPGLRCVFPDVQTKETTYGSCGQSTSIAEPVSLTYRFVFEQKGGKGVVSMGQGD